MEDSTTPILESENKTYDSDQQSALTLVKIEETSQIHSTDSPPIKPTDESNEVKTSIPKFPLSNERIKAILESIEPVPISELPPNLSSSTSRFYDGTLVNLPSGWLIEQKPRTNQEYLEKTDLVNLPSGWLIEQKPRTNQEYMGKTDLVNLPSGWLIEQKPRTNQEYMGKTDLFFYEPYTNNQFQSLKAVWEYFSEENKESQDGAVPLNPSTYHASEKRKSGEANEQGSYPWDEMKKKNKREQDSYIFDHQNPPESVTWCLEQVEEDIWIPLVNGRKVPDEIKDIWNEVMHANPNPDQEACGGK